MPDSQEIDPNVLSHRWFEYHLMQWNRNGGAWPYSNSNPAPPQFLAQVLRHGRIEPCVVQDLMKLPNDSLSGLIQGENISRVVWRFLCESSEQVLLEVGYPAVVRLLDCLWQAVFTHKKIPKDCFQSLLRLQNIFKASVPGPDLSLLMGKSKLNRLAPVLDSLIPGYEY